MEGFGFGGFLPILMGRNDVNRDCTKEVYATADCWTRMKFAELELFLELTKEQ